MPAAKAAPPAKKVNGAQEESSDSSSEEEKPAAKKPVVAKPTQPAQKPAGEHDDVFRRVLGLRITNSGR